MANRLTNRLRANLSTLYLGAVCLSGWALLGWSMFHWQSSNVRRFLVYLAVALLGSGMKVVLPSLNGTMSANFLFVLIGLAEFTLPETLSIACFGILTQSLWHAKSKFSFIRVAFNCASIALAAWSGFAVFHLQSFRSQSIEAPVALLFASAAFFVSNTLFIAGAIAMTEWKPVWPLWRDGYFWSFPVYLLGGVVAALIDGLSQWIGWQTALLLLPVLYVIHNAHRMHVERLETARLHAERERQHADDKASIQLRTIQALALAIEAKDGTTHEHLERVQVYAVAVGEDLGLGETELEALRAAAILHDVGKIAVPEYIISKPGRLTPAEFEKMKTHTIVGAQILEQVQFPYPVAPLVRAHHEKWDGSGYPDGLAGEAIPVGARILTAVDVLDALASDRQYRKAMPLHEAIAVLERDAGKMFDPKVVEVLSRRYVELEQTARRRIAETRPIIQTDVKVERGAAPDAGFESTAPASGLANLHRILSGKPFAAIDACADLSRQIEMHIPFDAFAVFVEQEQVLYSVFTNGPASAAVNDLQVPLGRGLAGWVAENRQPIINANPAVEPGLTLRASGHILRSALAVPFEPADGSLMVVCLYRSGRDAFGRDEATRLQNIIAKVCVLPAGTFSTKD